MRFKLVATVLVGSLLLPLSAVQAAGPSGPAFSVHLEDLTTTEVAKPLRQGTRTVIIPVGGVEQNGAHMALGKHNFRVRLPGAGQARPSGAQVCARPPANRWRQC